MKVAFLSASIIILLFCSLSASAQWSEQVGYEFCSVNGCVDGGTPVSALISDAQGNLYGTTEAGGAGIPSGGTVYELTPNGNGTWAETVLYSFCTSPQGVCFDGREPLAGLVFDRKGNLYGTTDYGGTYGNGAVFELSPDGNGTWAEQVLYSFGPPVQDGNNPANPLIFDSQGNLYGTCLNGGPSLNGTVFELSPGLNGQWTETIIYDFDSPTGGRYPASGVVMDKAGRLYGTTGWNGSQLNGTVYALEHTAGGWEEKTLHTFSDGDEDGFSPTGNLVLSAEGNLFGTTDKGGADGWGTVYEVMPRAVGNSPEVILHDFARTATDGTAPQAGVVFDSKGNLYGTTTYGVNGTPCNGYGCGTVFRLSPNDQGGWIETILYTFQGNGVDGKYPEAGVLLDRSLGIVGTDAFGGSGSHGLGDGTMFVIKP